MRFIFFSLLILCSCHSPDISYSPKSNPEYLIGLWTENRQKKRHDAIWEFATNKDLNIVFPNNYIDSSIYWVETLDKKEYLLLRSKWFDSVNIHIMKINYRSNNEIRLQLFAERHLDDGGKFWVEKKLSAADIINLVLFKQTNNQTGIIQKKGK